LCSDDPHSCSSGNIATGGASHARQVKIDDPDKERYHDSPGWGLGLEANSLILAKKILLLRSLMMGANWIIVVKDPGK